MILRNKKLTPLRWLGLNLLLLLAGCASDRQSDEPQSFTIAVIPDTQNYLDYRHQSANGFAIDASKLFSGELDNYVDWYKGREQPLMTAAEFLAADEFELELDDFRQRFGTPK